MGTTTADVALDLLERAHRGDDAAIAELVDEHLHPAWRIAVVAAPNEAVALGVLAHGFCEGLSSAYRVPDPFRTLRARIVGAVRHAAISAPAIDIGTPRATDPVLVAFFSLPEKSRTALWLHEVEGGTPEQAAPVLGLSRAETAAVSDRAWVALRDRLAADLAAAAPDEACRRALGRLGAMAAGKLTAADREKVEAHLGGCGSCALALASLVTPRPALRRAVPNLPAGLALAVKEEWASRVSSEQRKGGLTGWSERALGAAAAAVLAVGMAGAGLLGSRDRGGHPSNLAAPAGAVLDNDAGFGGAEGESAAGALPPTSNLGPTYVVEDGATGAHQSGGSTATSGGHHGGATPRGGGSGSDDPTAGVPKAPVSPSTPTGPTTPSTPSDPTTPDQPGTPDDPSTPPDSSDPTPLLPETGTQVDLGSGDGTLEVGVGDCTGVTVLGTTLGCSGTSGAGTGTGTPPVVSVQAPVPGLPPITL